RQANLESCSGVEEKLKSLEEKLKSLEEQLKSREAEFYNADLIQAWHAFVNQSYQSEWLSAKMLNILGSNKTGPVDKISILYGFAKLNDSNQKEVLKQLLKDLNDKDECRSLTMAVWLKLLYASSTLLSDDEEVKEIFQNMMNKQNLYKESYVEIASLYKS